MGPLSQRLNRDPTASVALATPKPAETRLLNETPEQTDDRLAQTYFYLDALLRINQEHIGPYSSFDKNTITYFGLKILLNQKTTEIGMDPKTSPSSQLNQLSIELFEPIFETLDPELNTQTKECLTKSAGNSYIAILAFRLANPQEQHLPLKNIPDGYYATNIYDRILSNNQSHLKVPTETDIQQSIVSYQTEIQNKN